MLSKYLGTSEKKQKKIEWRIVVEVARVQTNETTIIEPELMAATEAAKAACCLIQAGCIRFEFDGSTTQIIDSIEDILSSTSLSSRVSKDMVDEIYFRLGAKPKWHPQPRPCATCFLGAPWREKELLTGPSRKSERNLEAARIMRNA